MQRCEETLLLREHLPQYVALNSLTATPPWAQERAVLLHPTEYRAAGQVQLVQRIHSINACASTHRSRPTR